jgi:hypothetical protein
MDWNRKDLKDFQMRGLVRGLFDVQTHTKATNLDKKRALGQEIHLVRL